TESTAFLTPIPALVLTEWAWAWRSAGRLPRRTRPGSWSNPSPGSGQPSASSCPQAMPMTMQVPTVYIVDDDPDMRDSLAWLLKTVGLRSIAFETAADFLREFRSEGPACLVLDVRMPGTGG